MATSSSERFAWVLVAAALAAGNLYQYTRARRSASAPPAPSPAAAEPAEAISPDRVSRKFHLLSYNSENWVANKYLGIQTLQNPNDVWITQEIMQEVKPDFVVETGTHMGGSALLWATFLQQINPRGRVITIDLADRTETARRVPLFRERVDFLKGSSVAPEIVAEVTRRVKGGRVLVILDALHTRDHVLRELEVYGPLVPPGSYVIVQDTNVNGHPVLPDYGAGPWEAIDAFLPSHPEFRPDPARERFFFTMHPRGYLKREG